MDEDTVTRTSRSPRLYTAEHDPLSPHIFRLPTEILESIFILYAHQYSYDYDYPTFDPPDWVGVSYVCRLWRSVALNCPTLWTCIFITSPRWTEELLARSHHASLKVNICLSSRYMIPPRELVTSSIRPLLSHVERIQELRLSLPHSYDDLLVICSSRAPRLKHLELALPYSSPTYSAIPFHGDTSALRTLHLVHCHFPWYSFSLHRLTSLGLHTVSDQFKLPTEEFIDVLRLIQSLEILILDEALQSAAAFLSSESFDVFQPIDLPHLRRLEIRDSHLTIFALLSHVSIPLQTTIALYSNWADSDSTFFNDHDLPLLLPSRFSTSLNRPSSSPSIRSMVVRFQDLDQVTLVFSSLDEALDHFGVEIEGEGGCHVPLKIEIRFLKPMTMMGVGRIIGHICCSVPMPNVHTAHVFDPSPSFTFWSNVLGHLPDLHRLLLHGGNMPGLTSLLSLTAGNPGGNAEDGPDQVSVPTLEKLELYRVTFSRPSRRNTPQTANVTSLFDALASRRGSRGQLEMVRCIVPGHDRDMEMDVAGRWEDGRFHVIEERSRPLERRRVRKYSI